MIWIDLDNPLRQLLRDRLPDVALYFADKQGTHIDHEIFLQAEVVFGNIPPDWLNDAPRLRWLQLESVGFGEYQNVVQPGLTVSNLQGFGKHAVAETAVAGILVLYRRLDVLLPAQHERTWNQTAIRASSKMLRGSRVLILGNGHIGQQIGALLRAFGCEVTAFARNASDNIHALTELDTHLPHADIVVGCLPHTTETAGLLSAERIAKFKAGAMLVNVGRGSLVDESALVNALESGHLGGAVLDVTIEEPLPPDHLLWFCPNTILTQHTAGGYDAEIADRVAFFLTNLERYRAGEPVLNVVDFQRGY